MIAIIERVSIPVTCMLEPELCITEKETNEVGIDTRSTQYA